MNQHSPPVPGKTAIATQRPAMLSRTAHDRLMDTLLSNVDGHRDLIELESLLGRWACGPTHWSGCDDRD
jgi:hypothetical protein